MWNILICTYLLGNWKDYLTYASPQICHLLTIRGESLFNHSKKGTRGAPGWLHMLSICSGLQSGSQGSGIKFQIRQPAQWGPSFSLWLLLPLIALSLSEISKFKILKKKRGQEKQEKCNLDMTRESKSNKIN